MAFEKFTATKKRLGKGPTLTIWARGQMAFNNTAVEELKIRNYSHIELYFDDESRRIGFDFTNNENSLSAIPLKLATSTAIIFSAIPFLKHFKIFKRKTCKYDIKDDHRESGFYIIELGPQR